jgi:hypothetical protein
MQPKARIGRYPECLGYAMKYIVTDDFVAAHGWTPDKTARALMEPLAVIGVVVERVRGLGPGGFQSAGLPPDAFRMKKVEAIGVVGQVLNGHPLGTIRAVVEPLF